MDKKKSRRILMSVAGVIICGISVGMFKRAELGVDPFQSLMSGFDKVIPISFGALYAMVNVILLLFSLILDRRKIGLATLINVFFLGYIAEYTQKFLEYVFPEMNLAGQLLLLFLAVIITCISAALYFTADLGVSTYDAVSLIVSERQSGVSFKFCRVISDFTCVLGGVCLCFLGGCSIKEIGAEIGIGTIITAFFMGPLIDYFSVHLAKPFLDLE